MADSNGTFAGIPIPKEEKVVRWATRLGLAALAVIGINAFGPSINSALALLQKGFSSVLGLIWTFVAIAVSVVAIISLRGVFMRFMDAVANKLTWLVLEFDPIAPLRSWLDEVTKNGNVFSEQIEVIGGVIGKIMKRIDDLTAGAENAQKRAGAALKREGMKRQADTEAYRAGQSRDSAARYQRMLENLKPLHAELLRIYEAYQSEAERLKIDIDLKQSEWETYQASSAALDSAQQLLSKRSKKRQFYDQASQFITDRYASQFGRLQSLKALSARLIDSVDIEQGMYSEETFARLKAESTKLIGHDAGPHGIPTSVGAAEPVGAEIKFFGGRGE